MTSAPKTSAGREMKELADRLCQKFMELAHIVDDQEAERGRMVQEVASLRAQYAALAADVRDWVCPRCRRAYPGPPAQGLLCVPCPACGQLTMPRQTYEVLEYQNFVRDLAAMLVEPDFVPHGPPLLDRLRTAVGEVIRERGEARGGQHEAYMEVAELDKEVARLRELAAEKEAEALSWQRSQKEVARVSALALEHASYDLAAISSDASMLVRALEDASARAATGQAVDFASLLARARTIAQTVQDPS